MALVRSSARCWLVATGVKGEESRLIAASEFFPALAIIKLLGLGFGREPDGLVAPLRADPPHERLRLHSAKSPG